MEIIIKDLISNTNLISVETGEVVYKEINKHLKNNENVILNFKEVKIITAAFLNAAIGQLYNKYNSELLNEYLEIKELRDEDKALLIKVIERAKKYFKDKKGFSDIVKKSLAK